MKLFEQILPNVFENNVGFTGMTDELFCVATYQSFCTQKRSILIVTPSLFEANKIYDSLSVYTDQVLFFPMDDFLTSEAIAVSPDLMITRLETMNQLLSKKPKIVVTHLMGYLRFLPTPEKYQKSILSLSVNEDIDPQQLVNQLFQLGYHRETLVTRTGEVGVRGFVIDVFPVDQLHPIRFEFFGDTITSLRVFDEETQKSIESIQSIYIYPNYEFIADHYPENAPYYQKYLPAYSKQVVSILDYLDNPYVVYKDYNQLKHTYEAMMEEVFEYQTSKDTQFKGNYFFDFTSLNPKNLLYYFTIDNISPDKNTKLISFDAKELLSFNENIEAINKYLKENHDLGKTIVICLKDYMIKNFVKYLTVPYYHATFDSIHEHEINVVNFEMNQGFSYGNYIFLTDKELFRRVVKKKTYKTKFKYASKITDIHKLNVGDYVVHHIHGIGVYNGIKTLSKGGLMKDYLEVLYQGKDKLYIPVEKIDLISKYSGNEGVVPKINRLGGTEWQKTKQRVRGKIQDIAQQLLKLYAEREMRKGFAFQPDTALQIDFEKEFPYQETKDQILSIDQIKKDMESSRPMDRLLCGDVGYGKTEVAFRAAFKAIMDSKQVLYLCPTTILSNQQYENALTRFQHYPVNIALLNRFTTPKEVKRIVNGLKEGTIDFVFGTHRLLSDDIRPKDLGLLIIDEEQRFGVVHKEKIKKYKTNVDVLTLTATPIPRTLQMSMLGIRSLSLISTPPMDRYPVQTYVVEENNQIIRDAIYKELARDGQVFLLYNRVLDMDAKVLEIERLVPEATIGYAHGQMSKNELEDRMIAFNNHEFDVLICTTIIETGIDMPNVNTLLIMDADRFGLAQLYQIRGRVGRSNKIAYAYLMYQGGRMLTETAFKRLNAIKEFTELGSGFSIATRDLSIRGAGDILGSEQAGFIDTVGIDLYLKMIQEEVAHLKGEKVPEEELLDEKPYLDVETHIDDDYVYDNDLKIEIHKKINEIDSYTKLLQVKDELEDRFGKLEEPLIIYMYEEWFEKLAKKLEIIEVRQSKNSIELIFSEEMSKKIDGEQIFMDATKITPMFRFGVRGPCFAVILDTIRLEKNYIYYLIELLKTLEK